VSGDGLTCYKLLKIKSSHHYGNYQILTIVTTEIQWYQKKPRNNSPTYFFEQVYSLCNILIKPSFNSTFCMLYIDSYHSRTQKQASWNLSLNERQSFYFPKGKGCKTFRTLFQKCDISKMTGINNINLY
jgi:hypothetical protein